MDVLVSIHQEAFTALGFEKGGMTLVDAAEQTELLNTYGKDGSTLCAGGSVANSVVAFSQLGGCAAYACSLATDYFGNQYRSDLGALKVELDVAQQSSGATGTCVVLVTPDSERTMRTALGVATNLKASDLNEDNIAQSDWVFIEGYLLGNEGGPELVQAAAALAKKHGTRVALTLSDAFIVNVFGDQVRSVLPDVDMLFANQVEARALAGADSDQAAADIIIDKYVKRLVLTQGEQGVLVAFDSSRYHVDALECSPVDVTGAGDIFAGSFLYGLTHDLSPEASARKACALAKEKICQVGARYKGDLKEIWEKA